MASSSSSSIAPHFFKIIFPHNLKEGKLEIPKKFIRCNGGCLLDINQVSIKVPNGGEWEVELKNNAGNFTFEKGWAEIMEFYSVEVGFFMVFRSEGNSVFHLLIFDFSATEIRYRLKESHDRKGKNVVEEPKEEFGFEVDNKKIATKENQFMRRDKHCVKRDLDLEAKKRKYKGKYEAARKSKMGRNEDHQFDGNFTNPKCEATSSRPIQLPLTESEEKVNKKAARFKTAIENPSFMVTMRPSYIQTGSYLSLPRSFGEIYFKEEKTEVKLEISNGRKWKVWCGVRWAFTRRRTEFKKGWKRFAIDNDLKEGDICVFEFLKASEITLKVTIFRLHDY